MKNRKMIILAILVLICIVTSISIHKNYEGKNIEEIKEKTNKNNKLVFQVQQDDGSYKEQTSGTFPSIGYLINTEKTKCTGLEDKVITPTITYQNGTVTVTGQNTAYCEIYFDKCKIPETIKSSYYNVDFSKVYACEVGGMYRYQGTNDVNNYICFGTTDQNTCTSNVDKYMYRIIGITPDGKLKLLMNDFLRDTNGEYDAPSWGYMNNSCISSPDKCQWNNSYLYNDLNGLDSNIDKFKGNSYYSYLNNSTWSNLIDSNHKWKYGDISNQSKIIYNGYEMYNIENTFQDIIQAPIGTIYIHDYLFAYPGGNPGNAKTAVTSWMADSIAEQYYAYWTMTRLSGDSVANAYKINWSGDIYTDSWDPGTYVRPVFYLNSNVKIKNGAGSNIDPYILDVVDDAPAPTCHFEITNAGSATGVKLVHDNASSWYVSQSPTNDPQYGTSEYVSSMTGEKYYGYVKNDSGKTGKCELEMYQAKVNYCTTKENHTEDKQCTCTTTIVSCECDLGTPRFTYRTGQIGLSQCPETLSGSLPSITCENDFLRPCGEWVYNCTCNDCYGGTTTYTCSDNSTCTESGCCEKKSCGVETCQSGYETYTIDKDSIVYCYKNIS